MQPKQARYRRKRALGLFVSLCLILSSPLFLGDLRGAEPTKGPMDESQVTPDTQVLVTYYYTTYRCPTCKKLEAYSRQAIEEGFPRELEEKKIVFSTFNVDEPEHSHYTEDYKLVTKSLIISLNQEGKEIKWTNLADIWKLVGNQGKFKAYVQSETQAYLKDL